MKFLEEEVDQVGEAEDEEKEEVDGAGVDLAAGVVLGKAVVVMIEEAVITQAGVAIIAVAMVKAMVVVVMVCKILIAMVAMITMLEKTQDLEVVRLLPVITGINVIPSQR